MGRRVVVGFFVAGVLVGLLTYVLGSRPKRAPVPDPPRLMATARAVQPAQAPGGLVLPSWLVHPELPGQKVAGRVVRDGKPVPDASVRLKMSGVPEIFGDRLLRSDAEGRFDFGTQPAVGFLIVAWAPGAAPAARYLDLANPADRSAAADLALVLSDCKRSAFGRVRDAEGTPIAKARIRADGGPSVDTGDDGSFKICFDSPLLEVSADGYGTVWSIAYHSPVNLILAPEAGINGVVLAPDDTAAPRAMVSVSPSAGYGVAVAVAADDAGHFQVRALAGGLFTATAAGEEAVPRDAVQVVVEPGAIADVTLRLAPASTLRGVVLVGEAPASVRLWASSRRTQWNVATTSGADGRFVLGPVPFEEIRLFDANGSSPPEPPSFRPTRALHEGLTLRFPLGATIRGRVLRDGRPAVGASVRCGQMYARVDDAGQYVCERLVPQEMQIIAYTEHARSEPVTVTPTAGEGKELNLELVSGGASVSGVVVDERGEPVAGAQVTLFGPNTSASSEPTTPRGEFRAEHVAAGNLQVAVLGEDGRTNYPAPSRDALPRVEVGDRDVKDIRLIVRRPKFLTIAGKVVDAAGAPVPDARIEVVRLEPGMVDLQFDTYEAPRCITDHDGRFVLDRLAEGTYALRAATASTAGTVRDVPAGARNVVIALPASASIEGRLIGFRAAARVDAFARNVGAIYLHAEVAGDSFRFPSLAPGRYVVAAEADDGGAAAEVEVAPGTVARVTLVGRGVGSVVVRVVDPRSSQPITGAQCNASLQVGKDGSPFVAASARPTDSNGETLLERVPGGDLIVSCYHGMTFQQSESRPVSLAPGQTAVVELSLLRRRGPGGTMFDALVGRRAAVIEEVRPESSAARAGFVVGDVIVAVDGMPTGGLDAGMVDALIADRAVGALAEVTVRRGDETLTLSVAIVAAR